MMLLQALCLWFKLRYVKIKTVNLNWVHRHFLAFHIIIVTVDIVQHFDDAILETNPLLQFECPVCVVVILLVIDYWVAIKMVYVEDPFQLFGLLTIDFYSYGAKNVNCSKLKMVVLLQI